jgi:hypothetical protein
MLTPDEFQNWQAFEKSLSDLRLEKVRRHLKTLGFQNVEYIPSGDVLEMADRAVDLYLRRATESKMRLVGEPLPNGSVLVSRSDLNEGFHGRTDNLTASDRRFMYECGIEND